MSEYTVTEKYDCDRCSAKGYVQYGGVFSRTQCPRCEGRKYATRQVSLEKAIIEILKKGQPSFVHKLVFEY